MYIVFVCKTFFFQVTITAKGITSGSLPFDFCVNRIPPLLLEGSDTPSCPQNAVGPVSLSTGRVCSFVSPLHPANARDVPILFCSGTLVDTYRCL